MLPFHGPRLHAARSRPALARALTETYRRLA